MYIGMSCITNIAAYIGIVWYPLVVHTHRLRETEYNKLIEAFEKFKKQCSTRTFEPIQTN